MRRHLGRMIRSKIYFRKINMKAIWRENDLLGNCLGPEQRRGGREGESQGQQMTVCVHTYLTHGYYPAPTTTLPVYLHLKRQRKQIVSCMNNCCRKYGCQAIL